MSMVYMALPMYDQCSKETVESVVKASKEHDLMYSFGSMSALCLNFNTAWCDMLNKRVLYPDMKWFGMLHSDIGVADMFWLDKMVRLAEEYGTDVLSVVSPLKDQRGLTSTGIYDKEYEVIVKRLSVREVNKIGKSVFGLDEIERLGLGIYDKHALVVNTGLMLVRIGDWCENIRFHTKDYVIKKEGQWIPQFISEDWLFSVDVHEQGKVVKVCSGIEIVHVGKKAYSNKGDWGTLKEDDLT